MSHEKSNLPNWTGLLSWSTKYHDGTSASQFDPIDQDRREWLEKALNSAFDGQEDPNKIMKQAVVEIQEGRLSTGLDLLEHVSDNLDCAENLDSLGALKPLVDLLSNPDQKIVQRSLEVLNLYLPNNPKIQLIAATNHGCLDALKTTIEAHRTNNLVISLGISTIGNLLRNVIPLENSFLKDRGLRYTCEIVLTSFTPSVVKRSCNLMASLIRRHTISSSDVDVIRQLLVRVYETEFFDKFDIQLFENVANLAGAVGMSDSLRQAVAERVQWIKSLETESQSEFNVELECLLTAESRSDIHAAL
jgi:hypothetical protein